MTLLNLDAKETRLVQLLLLAEAQRDDLPAEYARRTRALIDRIAQASFRSKHPCFDTEEDFLKSCKTEAEDGNSNLSSGEVILLIEIIERLRGVPVTVDKE